MATQSQPNQLTIACNKCFNPAQSQSLYLTQCGHIACSVCLFGSRDLPSDPCGRLYSCPVCSERNQSVVSLDDNLPPELETYFRPLESLAGDLAQAIAFQTSNQSAYIAHLCKKLDQQANILERIQDDIAQAKDYATRIRTLEQENEALKRRLSLQGHQRLNGTSDSSPTERNGFKMPQISPSNPSYPPFNQLLSNTRKSVVPSSRSGFHQTTLGRPPPHTQTSSSPYSRTPFAQTNINGIASRQTGVKPSTSRFFDEASGQKFGTRIVPTNGFNSTSRTNGMSGVTSRPTTNQQTGIQNSGGYARNGRVPMPRR